MARVNTVFYFSSLKAPSSHVLLFNSCSVSSIWDPAVGSTAAPGHCWVHQAFADEQTVPVLNTVITQDLTIFNILYIYVVLKIWLLYLKLNFYSVPFTINTNCNSHSFWRRILLHHIDKCLFSCQHIKHCQIPAGFLQVGSWWSLGSGQVRLSSLKLALYKMFKTQIIAELISVFCK